MKRAALFCILLLNGLPSFSQVNTNMPLTRILFLVDGSSSMTEEFGVQTKMIAAQKILSEIVDSLAWKPNIEIALRVYGHQSDMTLNNCNDTKLEVPFGSANVPYIRQALQGIKPKGVTPIAYSLEKCAADFPPDPSSRKIVVLITDGEESCGGDPCAVSLSLQRQNIILKPFVIGLNLNTLIDASMECIGTYFNAGSPDILKAVLEEVIDRILSSSSVQVNLLDVNHKPLETDVDMTFMDAFTGVSKYNFYHTLNYHGEPDTVSIDPVSDYDLVIHTVPPIRREHLQLKENSINVIDIPAAQGFLKIELLGSTINKNLNSKIKCLVRRAGTYETVRVQELNAVEKLLTGRYDIEVLTLPRTEIRNVEVNQSTTTTVQVQAPGVLNITKSATGGNGAIFMTDKNKLVKIYQLNENVTNEMVGLQPGNYVVVFKPKLSKKTTDTIEKKITITSSQSISLKL